MKSGSRLEPVLPVVTHRNGNGHGPDAGRPTLPPTRPPAATGRASWWALRKTKYGLAPVVVLSGVIFFQVFDDQFFRIAGPNIVRDLHSSVSAILGVYALVATVSIIGAIAVSYFSDGHRRLPLVGLGSIISGAAATVLSRGTTAAVVATAKTVDTGSSNITMPPQDSLIADYYPPEVRASAYSLKYGANLIGTLAAPALTGVLIYQIGWRTTSVLIGIPMVVMGVVCLAVLREPIRGYFERREMGANEEIAMAEDARPSFGEGWRTVWSIRTLRRLFIANVFYIGGYLIFDSLIGFFLADRYGLNAAQRGMAAIPGLLAAMAGAYTGGIFFDRITRRNGSRALAVVAAGSVGTAIGLTIFGLELPLPVAIAGLAIANFCAAVVYPASAAVHSEVVPARVRTLGLQLVTLSGLPGPLILIPLAGQIQAQYGYTAAILMGAPLMLIGALIQFGAAGFFEIDKRNANLSANAAEEYRQAATSGAAKLLVCRSLDVAYEANQVLFGVDFDVEAGEIIALLGTNGAGKSTLLRAISGTQEASDGAIIFDGRDITHVPPHETAALGVIHMPGGRGTFPGLTVRENLMLGNWMASDRASATAALARVYELFPILRERGEEIAGSLSGGEQQMLSLAQAFLSKPRLLMIDELSLGLSPAVVGQLLEIVKEIHANGTAIVVVEQSVNVALTIAQRAVFMEKGEVKFFGATADLLSRPDILRAVYVKGTGALTGEGGGAARVQAFAGAEAAVALDVAGITKRYGGVQALDGVSFRLKQGEVLGIIGPNGSGKTTLFDIISGYQVADSGKVSMGGVDLTGMSPEERARRKLVRRFQDARLFPSLTVFETLLIALDQRLEVRNAFLAALSTPSARRSERRATVQADRLVDLLELGAYRDKFVRELSTGLRRVVDLACVLATEPKVLLLDEPSSGIAQAESESLGPLLRRVRHETGCSMLLIEHDMPLISAVADELIALDRGAVLVRGTAQEVLNDQRVIDAYLGGSEAAVTRSGSLKG